MLNSSAWSLVHLPWKLLIGIWNRRKFGPQGSQLECTWVVLALVNMSKSFRGHSVHTLFFKLGYTFSLKTVHTSAVIWVLLTLKMSRSLWGTFGFKHVIIILRWFGALFSQSGCTSRTPHRYEWNGWKFGLQWCTMRMGTFGIEQL